MGNHFFLNDEDIAEMYTLNCKHPKDLIEKIKLIIEPSTNKNCLWNWKDGEGNLPCPILERDNLATWQEVVRACARCPRYLKVIGTKKLLIKKVNEEQTPKQFVQEHSYNSPSDDIPKVSNGPQPRQKSCESCNTAPIRFFCETSKMKLCSICANDHQSFGHKVIDIVP